MFFRVEFHYKFYKISSKKQGWGTSVFVLSGKKKDVKGQRNKEKKEQRDKEKKEQRDKEKKEQRDKTLKIVAF